MLAAEILTDPLDRHANEGPIVRCPGVGRCGNVAGVIQRGGEVQPGGGRGLVDFAHQGPPGRRGKLRGQKTEEVPGGGVIDEAQGHHRFNEPSEIDFKK